MKIGLGHFEVSNAFAQFVPGFQAFLKQRPDVELFPNFPLYSDMQMDGMIIQNQDIIGKIPPDQIKHPIVCIKGASEHPTVDLNYRSVGHMAARYFLKRGYRHFGYFLDGSHKERSLQQWEGFADELQLAGFEADQFFNGVRGQADKKWSLNNQLLDLQDWICTAPKPYAVLASDDHHAYRLVMAAQRAKVTVPDQLAILGVHNHLVMCEISQPTISSISFDPAELGYKALSWMVDRIEGRAELGLKRIYVDPSNVVTRRSTDTYALGDEDVLSTIRFINTNLSESLRVEDLADHVHLSRSSLERKFKENLNVSPGQFIRQARIDHAIRQLYGSNLPLIDIAELAGYSSSAQLSRDIKSATGYTPTELRRQKP